MVGMRPRMGFKARYFQVNTITLLSLQCVIKTEIGLFTEICIIVLLVMDQVGDINKKPPESNNKNSNTPKN